MICQKWHKHKHHNLLKSSDHFMKPSRPASSDFLPHLERNNGISLERQLVHGFRQAILDGQLGHGMRLPSSRVLANTLKVNRNTVIAALEQLLAEGYLETKRGSGTFVYAQNMQAQAVTHLETARWLLPAAHLLVAPPVQSLEFRVCQIATNHFPLLSWRKSWLQAVQAAPPDDYQNALGEPSLRQAIGAYLQRARGLNSQPEDMLICNGTIQALHLICQATLQTGSSVAFEDPGFPLARQVFLSHQAKILPIPVDQDGLLVDQLPTGKNAPVLVYVTPSHQFPLGGRLSLARRLALLEWAKQNDALILEDDYDSEFRFDVPPLPPLASLDHSGRVAYIGTFSKVLTPALRLGYIISTPALRQRLCQYKTLADYQTNQPSQLAMTHFIETGALERHIAKMRRMYAHKRSTLVHALEPIAKLAKVRGLEAGINIFLECQPHVPLENIVARCAKQGLVVSTVGQYALQAKHHGLVLGYGALEPEEIIQAAKILVGAFSR